MLDLMASCVTLQRLPWAMPCDFRLVLGSCSLSVLSCAYCMGRCCPVCQLSHDQITNSLLDLDLFVVSTVSIVTQQLPLAKSLATCHLPTLASSCQVTKASCCCGCPTCSILLLCTISGAVPPFFASPLLCTLCSVLLWYILWPDKMISIGCRIRRSRRPKRPYNLQAEALSVS
jgi:hypothetical protein